MLTDLNEDQRALMASVRDEWIAYALNLPTKGEGGMLVYTPPPPIKDLRENVDWLYRFCSLPSPCIIEVESPLGLQLAANWGPLLVETGLAAFRDQVGRPARDRAGAQAGGHVRARAWDLAGDLTGDLARHQIRDMVKSQVWREVVAPIEQQTWYQVSDQVREQVRHQIWYKIQHESWGQIQKQIEEQVGDWIWSQVADRVRGQVADRVRGQVADRVWGQVKDRIWAQIQHQVWSQAGDQVAGKVWEQVRGQIWSQVQFLVWDRVRHQVETPIWNQANELVWGQVVNQVQRQIRDPINNLIECKTWGLTGLATDSGWTAFYDFFNRLGMIESPAFNAWRRFMRSGIWDCVLMQGMVIVCRRPLAVRRDSRNRLHALDRPAIEWADGFRLHYVSGVAMAAETIDRPETITVGQILGEDNAEIRKALIQIRGVGWFLDQTGARVLDEDLDRSGMPRRLFRFRVRDTPWCVLEVECPSKRDKHYLWVPPNMVRCSQACAWTFGFDAPDQYRPLVEA